MPREVVSMKMIFTCGVLLCLLLPWSCLAQTISSNSNSMELQAVLFSDCVSPQEKTVVHPDKLDTWGHV
jgi:hypothetical protein